MLKKSDDEIWEFYQHITRARQLMRSGKSYCQEHNIDYLKFRAHQVRIEYITLSKPTYYAQAVELCRKYRETGLSRAKYCKLHNVSLRLLTDTLLHLDYLDTIQRLKKAREDQPMSFIQVKTPQTQLAVVNLPEEPELIEPQNDLEIIISKGVKVSISHNIDTIKVVKIIEFLRDL